MKQEPNKKTSKFLSLVLRHQPEVVGVEIEPQGWASIEALARLTADLAPPRRLTRAVIEALAADDAGRFELSEDRAFVRAVHGHSIKVELELAPAEPPETLFHGTVARFLDAIFSEGLSPQSRRFVHLSETVEAARRVGARRGAPVILTVAAGELHRAGQLFHRSSSGVWLTAAVPAGALARLDAARA